MVTITQLRRNNELNKKLGFRERDILYSIGATVKKAKDYPSGFYEVRAGRKKFVFNLNSRQKPKYEIVA